VTRLSSPPCTETVWFFFPSFMKEVKPVFQVQPTTPSRGSSCWYPVPTIHMRYMTFFCLCAKGRWLLCFRLACRNSAMPPHSSLCTSIIMFCLSVPLLPQMFLHQTLLFPHINIMNFVYIPLHYGLPSDPRIYHLSLHPHPAHWGVTF